MDKTIEQLLKDLQGLRNEFNDFLYYLPDALLEVDLQTRRLTYMNRMANILFGYSEADFSSGVPIAQLFDGKEYERAVAIITQYVSQSREQRLEYTRSGRTELYEFSMRRKDGSVFPAETQTSFVLDRNHIPVAMRTIVRDISARKIAEAPFVKEAQRAVARALREELPQIVQRGQEIATGAKAEGLVRAGESIVQSARRLADKFDVDLNQG